MIRTETNTTPTNLSASRELPSRRDEVRRYKAVVHRAAYDARRELRDAAAAAQHAVALQRLCERRRRRFDPSRAQTGTEELGERTERGDARARL